MILGIDPGMASLGYSVLTLDGELVNAGVIRTEKINKKQKNFHAVSSDVERLRYILRALKRVLADHEIKLMAIEMPSFHPKFAKQVVRQISLVWGAMVGLSEEIRCPIVQVSPQEARKNLLGKSQGSKEDLQKALCGKLKHASYFAEKFPATQREHLFDACAVAFAAINSEMAMVLAR